LAYFYRACAWIGNKKNECALADLNCAIALAPEQAVSYLMRSLVYELLGDSAESEADMKKALKLEPELKDLDLQEFSHSGYLKLIK